MEKQLKKGTLKRWNDDKGFGFISAENEKDIFIHISAFKRSGYHPKVGDVIFYQIHTDNDGKMRAVNANVEGMPESKPQPRANQRKTTSKSQSSIRDSLLKWVAAICIVGFAAVIYSFFTEELPQPTTPSTVSAPAQTIETQITKPQHNFTCEGKQHCSEMRSCEEATFYLKNCPNVKIDGDGDGRPCEGGLC